MSWLVWFGLGLLAGVYAIKRVCFAGPRPWSCPSCGHVYELGASAQDCGCGGRFQ